MNPVDLTDDEVLALVGLLRHVAVADGDISGEESHELHALGEELGRERFLAAWRRSRDELSEPQQALDFAADYVHRTPARELVVTMLSDLAAVDELHPTERVLLGKVRLMWGLFQR